METHYAYITFNGRDIATKTFNLFRVSARSRSELIGRLINDHGECLAKLPLKFDMIDKNRIDLKELTAFINGEDNSPIY